MSRKFQIVKVYQKLSQPVSTIEAGVNYSLGCLALPAHPHHLNIKPDPNQQN